MVSASGISIKLLSSDPNALCHRLKLLLQQKQVGNNSNKINGEMVAIVHKLLEYKCISKKQHKQILIKCNLLKFFTSQMSKLNEKDETDRRILKCDYIRYSPAEIITVNTAKNQVNINLPREASVISLLGSYLALIFDVLQAATNNRYLDAKDIRLVNLVPKALFSNYKLTTSSG